MGCSWWRTHTMLKKTGSYKRIVEIQELEDGWNWLMVVSDERSKYIARRIGAQQGNHKGYKLPLSGKDDINKRGFENTKKCNSTWSSWDKCKNISQIAQVVWDYALSPIYYILQLSNGWLRKKTLFFHPLLPFPLGQSTLNYFFVGTFNKQYCYRWNKPLF